MSKEDHLTSREKAKSSEPDTADLKDTRKKAEKSGESLHRGEGEERGKRKNQSTIFGKARESERRGSSSG